MSIRLLAPVLEPAGMEAGLRAVIERLNSDGEVAHEEDVGEFAILRRLAEGEPADGAPILDYKMIDDDYMLPVVAEHYLLEMADAERAAAFLARTAGDGETYGAALARNFAFVIDAAAPFAAQPGWQRLIELKPGQKVGNWRDSELGLGNGRYPYDVNAVFVPAALAAIGRIADSGLLTPHIDSATAKTFAGATALAKVWLELGSAPLRRSPRSSRRPRRDRGIRRRRRCGCRPGIGHDWERAGALLRPGTRRPGRAGPGPELGRGLRTALPRSASGYGGPDRHLGGAAVPGRTLDGRGAGCRQSGLRR